MISLSSTENETASPCVPSRSVVSNVWMRMELLGYRGGFLLLRYAFLLLFLAQERHHLPEFFAHSLHGLIMASLAQREEFVTAGLVFFDPFARELPGLNLRQDLFHLFARLGGNDARPTRVIAILGRVGDRVTHVAEAAFIDQIDNQLHFVQALEVSDFGGITGFDQGLKTRADQLADT